MVAHFRIIFGVEASWSWLEKGHRKGGVGGAVKKLADNLIKTAQIIDSAENFYREVSQATDVMILLRTEEADIESSACEIKSCAWVDGDPHDRWHRRIHLDKAHKLLSCMFLHYPEVHTKL